MREKRRGRSSSKLQTIIKEWEKIKGENDNRNGTIGMKGRRRI